MNSIIGALMQGASPSFSRSSSSQEIKQKVSIDEALVEQVTARGGNVVVIQNATIAGGVPGLIVKAQNEVRAIEKLAEKQHFIETGKMLDTDSLEYAVRSLLAAGETLPDIRRRVEEACYDYALATHDNNRAAAGRMLGMSRTSVVGYAQKRKSAEV